MDETFHLEEADRRIIRALQRDGSLSNAALAEEVSSSPASCWRRVKALEDAGVLLGAVRLVDPARVGRGVTVMLQIRLKSHDPVKRGAFETFVGSREEVLECFTMSGEWDYWLRVVSADVSDYERFLMGEILSHPNVATTSSHFALSRVKYTTAIPV